MKKILIAAGFGVLLFAGCKEIPPVINFGHEKVTDTTYVLSTIPSAQAHNVLVEEFTGESCSNCPAAHTLLDGIVAANPGRVNVVSLYENSTAPINVPPTGANYDLRDSVASEIAASTVYTTNQDANYGNLPGAGIDRVPVAAGTTTWLGSSQWSALISSRLSAPDSINLGISSIYDTSSGIATITAMVTYVQAVSTSQNLTIEVVEDSIIDFQEEPFGVIDTTYLFNDVLVGMVTAAPYGDPILDTMATKVAGRFFQRVYSYHLPAAFRKGIVYPAHCRVIGFINAPSGSNPDFRVMQSQQTKLMGP